MKITGIALLMAVLTLAACGADGPPIRPTASTGLSLGSGGVSTYTSVGASAGNVSFGLGL